MSLNIQQSNQIQALLTASQQDEPLPANLQAQLQSIGQNLENRAMEIPTITASLLRLSNAY